MGEPLKLFPGKGMSRSSLRVWEYDAARNKEILMRNSPQITSAEAAERVSARAEVYISAAAASIPLHAGSGGDRCDW